MRYSIFYAQNYNPLDSSLSQVHSEFESSLGHIRVWYEEKVQKEKEEGLY